MDTVVHGLNGLDVSWVTMDHVVLGHHLKTQTQPNSKIQMDLSMDVSWADGGRPRKNFDSGFDS
jgi:hypothetical protein